MRPCRLRVLGSGSGNSVYRGPSKLAHPAWKLSCVNDGPIAKGVHASQSLGFNRRGSCDVEAQGLLQSCEVKGFSSSHEPYGGFEVFQRVSRSLSDGPQILKSDPGKGPRALENPVSCLSEVGCKRPLIFTAAWCNQVKFACSGRL